MVNIKDLKKLGLLLSIILFSILISSCWGKFFLSEEKSNSLSENNNYFGSELESCSVEKKVMTVQGNSLAPLINSGQDVEILFGYYDCYLVERGDVVLVRYMGNDNLLIKIVRGLPGDGFELKEKNNGWNILVNGEVLRNSENENYLINNKEYQMLSLYEKDYEKTIPDNAYLLLGNKVSGSLVLQQNNPVNFLKALQIV